MRRIWFFLLVLGISGCRKNQPETVVVEIPEETQTEILPKEFYEYKTDSLSPTRFRLQLSDDERTFWLFCTKVDSNSLSTDSIVIREKRIKTKAKVIRINNDWTFGSLSQMGFSIGIDVNFDGFRDLSVNNYTGMYTYTSSFWIFDPENNDLVHVPSLDSIMNPEFDAKSKRILSDWHYGLMDHGHDTYFWKDGKVVLLESILRRAYGSEEENNVVEIKRLINGKYVTKDSVISP